MTATEARVHFGEVLRRAAEDDETILVERGGQPKVVVMSIRRYDRLNAQIQETRDDALDRAIDLGRSIRERRGSYTLPPSEDVIEEARRERDAELDRLR